MACVKEYEIKIKMVQEQWIQLKMKFLLVFIEVSSGEGTNLWWGKKLLQVWGEWANFWLVAVLPPIPQYVYIRVYSRKKG